MRPKEVLRIWSLGAESLSGWGAWRRALFSVTFLTSEMEKLGKQSRRMSRGFGIRLAGLESSLFTLYVTLVVGIK